MEPVGVVSGGDQQLGGDFGAFDKETEDKPSVNQKVLNEEIGDVDKAGDEAKAREAQAKKAAKDADADAPVTTTNTK